MPKGLEAAGAAQGTQSRLPRGRGVMPQQPPRSPPGCRRFRFGLLGESSGLWLGKDDGRRRAPAGTVGWSQSSPLEVLRAEPGSSRHWAQGHFRFISVSPREPGAEREIAVVRRDGNPSYGDRVRWLVTDSERSMVGPPRRGGLAPRLPSAFPGPPRERGEGAAGQEVGPYALPVAGLPVPPLCPGRAAGEGVGASTACGAAGKVAGRSGAAKAEGAAEGGGRGRLGPAAGAAPFLHRRAAGGREQRPPRAAPAPAPARWRCAKTKAPGRVGRVVPAAGSGSAAMEPAPSGATGALPLWDPLSPLLLTPRPSSAAAAATPKRPRAASTVLGATPPRPRRPLCPCGSPGPLHFEAVPAGGGPVFPATSACGAGGRASRSGCRSAGAVVLGSTGWKGEKAAGAESARRILARGEPRGPVLGPAAWGESRLGPGGRGSPGCSRPPLKHVWA